jgi:hypothetical protein
MTHIREDLRKGALIAKDPLNYEKIPNLEDDEKAALYTEATHKWKHPTALYVTIITCSIGAAVQSVFQLSEGAIQSLMWSSLVAFTEDGTRRVQTVPTCPSRTSLVLVPKLALILGSLVLSMPPHILALLSCESTVTIPFPK